MLYHFIHKYSKRTLYQSIDSENIVYIIIFFFHETLDIRFKKSFTCVDEQDLISLEPAWIVI